MSFCCKPGIVWSFGGAGSTIGANNGSPLPAAFGVAAWATPPRASALHTMTVRMLHFIDGSMA
eukprot:gene19823-23571_t